MGKKREAKDTKNSYCANERTRSVKICKRVGEFANNVIRKLNMRIPLINCMGKTFLKKCKEEIRVDCNATPEERAIAAKAVKDMKKKAEAKKVANAAVRPQVQVAVKPQVQVAVRPQVQAAAKVVTKAAPKAPKRRVQATAAPTTAAPTQRAPGATPVDSSIKSGGTVGAKLPESGVKVPENIEGDGQLSGFLLKSLASACILLSMYIIN